MSEYKRRISILFLLFSLFFSSSFSQELNLLFAGDAMQHQLQIESVYRGGTYDYSSYFPHIEHEVSQADIAFVNLEVTLAGKPYTGYPSFSAPDEYAVALQKAGFDVFLTANNHILDKGSKGLHRTLVILDSLGVKHTGSFRDSIERSIEYPLFIDKNGFRIAVLNYTYGTNGLIPKSPQIVNYINKQGIENDIKKARNNNADLVIANMHWGSEYKLIPNKEQKSLADFLVKKGVDLVIGSHPHVVQPSRLIRDEDGIARNLIVYSLGNLISNMRAHNTDGGQLIRVSIEKKNDRIQIKSAGYILVYSYKPTSENKIDFQVIPADLIESHPHSDLFFRNAREILNKHNEEVLEVQIRRSSY